MPFIPHTDADIEAMLRTIGVQTIEDLFDEIPQALRAKPLTGVPEGASEMELMRVMQEKSRMDKAGLCFIGAGAYEHHIPAAVWEVATRGEYYTAYTPYQAEASQGTLQVLYEYQTMIANLTAMDASNASLYDGATALAEAILMACRSQRKIKQHKVLIPQTLHPFYRQVLQTIVAPRDIELIELPFCEQSGTTLLASLDAYKDQAITALVIAQPNFFGGLEDVDSLSNWAQQQKALSIAVVNPMSLAVLAAPGHWGEQGVDIVCGEGQPLGVPMASGGPYFGFMSCKQALVRQLPGRIVGRTVDLDGQSGFTLTLQAREQHIRRSKATSNICTNQGLAVTAATIYMSLLGQEGLSRVAAASHANTKTLVDKLASIDGVEKAFQTTEFHEAVIKLNQPVASVMEELAAVGIQAGFDLSQYYPQLGNCLLVCATETKTPQDLDDYQQRLSHIMTKLSTDKKQPLETA